MTSRPTRSVSNETTALKGIEAAALVPTTGWIDQPRRSARAPTSRSSLDLPTPAAPAMTTATGGSASSRSKIAASSGDRPTRGHGFTPEV